MSDKLREELVKFKNTTLRLFEVIEEENYDMLNPLLAERQGYIDRVMNLEYTQEEIAAVFSELELLKLEDKLQELMKSKLGEAKAEINKLSKSKTANKSYHSKFNVDSLYFNKKI